MSDQSILSPDEDDAGERIQQILLKEITNQTQLSLSFFYFLLAAQQSVSQFRAGASKPGVFNEGMCSVMERADLKPRCDRLSSIWPPGLNTQPTSAQIKEDPPQPSSRETSSVLASKLEHSGRFQERSSVPEHQMLVFTTWTWTGSSRVLTRWCSSRTLMQFV